MKILFTLLSVVFVALVGLAQAQQPPHELPTRLPAITVIAEKVPAPAQSIPVSVTAVTGATIDDADVHSMKDAAVYAPNVFPNEFSVRHLSNPYFRGVGSSPNNPGVTTYLDGVPQLNANSSNIELLDLDQIEFVRGPQGALYGRNTVGGLINVTSRRPALDAWRAAVDTEYGNYNFRDERFALSGPVVTNQLGLSLAGGYSARDGYTRNALTGRFLDGREAFFGKLQLAWVPVERWEVRLIQTGERDRDGDYALGDLRFIREHPQHVEHAGDGHTQRDVVAPTLLVNHHGSAVDFAMITGLEWWRTRDFTELAYDGPYWLGTRDDSEKDFQFTQEFRLASAKDAPMTLGNDLQLKWLTGLFIFTQNYRQDAVNNFAPRVVSNIAVSVYSPKSQLDDVGVGAYARTTLTVWENLNLILGVRGDYENKAANLATSSTAPISPSKDYPAVSPQFGLDYRCAPGKSIYGTISRGFKAGGFNPIAPAGREAYGQESSWNYEVGNKTAWLDDRLTVNLAAFYINWSDLQLNLPLGTQYYIANAGNADSKGVELEVNLRPVAGWDVFSGVGYTDARFLSGATTIQTGAYGNNSTVNVGGRHLIYTPEFTANAGSQYTWQICQAAVLYARAEIVVYGDYWYNPANTAAQTAYSLTNFRAGLRGHHWFAEGWVNNAFDTHYVPIAFEYPGGSGFIGESGAPVTFGLRAGLNF